MKIWLFDGDALDRLRDALQDGHKLRVALDEGELKFKVNERTWSPGYVSNGNDAPASH